MAAYPSYNQSLESRPLYSDGRLVDRTEDGTMKQRLTYSAEKVEFTVIHPALTTAERDTLKTFYTNNRALAFSFVWQDTMENFQNCRFLDTIEDVPLGNGRYRCTARIGVV